MENFIPAIRTDRLREMKGYDERNYSFIDRASYRIIEKIQTLQEGCEAFFGVEATQNDVYFYLIDNQANTYLSIYEIYQLLLEISRREGTQFVVNALKKQLRLKIRRSPDPKKKEEWLHQQEFEYRGIRYHIRETVDPGRCGEIEIPDMDFKISYRKLLVLINLIQEKSNALFLRGRQNKKYADGILRLFVVLLSKHEEIPLLTGLGWRYDAGSDQFLFQPPGAENERNKRKYYLTKQEFDTIMK